MSMQHGLTPLILSTLFAAGIALNANAAAVFEGPISTEDDKFVLQNGASAEVNGVSVDTTGDKGEWHEFLVSAAAKIQLGGGKTYKISFDYAVSKVKSPDTKFYELLRCGDSSLDKGWDSWSAKPGEKGHKSFAVFLKDSGYKLVFGVRFGGAIRVSNIKIDDVSPAPGTLFAGEILNGCGVNLSTAAKALPDGSIEANTVDSANEWNEYLTTSPDQIVFTPGSKYKISYDYVVEKSSADTQFYQFLRTSGGEADKDLAWDSWTAQAGDKGHKECLVDVTGKGYRFILGVHFKGAIKISNLQIVDEKPAK